MTAKQARPGFVTSTVVGGTVIAKCDRAVLHHSMLTEFARGIRTGVPAHMLDGYAAITTMNRLAVHNDRRHEVERLQRELADAEQLASRARSLAAAEDELGETATADGYKADARRHTKTAATLRARLADRHATSASPLPTDPIEAEVTFLLRALRVLTLDQAQMTKERNAAITQVLHELHFEVTNAAITWSAGLRVPANGGVLVLGPFTGSIDNLAQPRTPAEQALYGASTDLVRARQRLRFVLRERGITSALAHAAVLAPGLHLARALAGEHVIWPDCPDGYDHGRFNAFVREQWAKRVAWSAKRYVYPNPKRQALTDLVAALGGQARLDQVNAVCTELGIRRTDVHPMSQPRPTPGNRVPYPPTVTRLGQWSPGTPISDSLLCSVLCPRCGNPATAVARVLEIPSSLLCRDCLIDPANPAITYPPMYGQLALPTVRFAAHVLARAKRGGDPAS